MGRNTLTPGEAWKAWKEIGEEIKRLQKIHHALEKKIEEDDKLKEHLDDYYA